MIDSPAGMKTTGHSKPLAAWILEIVTCGVEPSEVLAEIVDEYIDASCALSSNFCRASYEAVLRELSILPASSGD